MNSHCIFCGHVTRWVRHCRLPSRVFGVRAEIRRCAVCGVGQTVPAPNVNIEYYAASESRYARRYESHGQRTLYRSFGTHLLNFIERSGVPLTASCRLLDVGAGAGWLVEQARVRGAVAAGIEVNRANVREAKANGIPLYESLDEFRSNSQSQYGLVDVLVFSAVLEHMPDPLAFMAAYLPSLRPGGFVIISQAAYDGLLPRVAPWLWYGWQPREHYWHFSERALRRLVRCAGLDLVTIWRNSLHHPFVLSGDLKKLVGKNAASALGRLGTLLRKGDQLYAAARAPLAAR